MVSRRIQKTNRGQYLLTLPPGVVEGLGWSAQTEIDFQYKGENRLELRKK